MTGSRKWPLIRRLPVWRWVAQYFPISIIKTADLDPAGGPPLPNVLGAPIQPSMNMVWATSRFEADCPYLSASIIHLLKC